MMAAAGGRPGDCARGGWLAPRNPEVARTAHRRGDGLTLLRDGGGGGLYARKHRPSRLLREPLASQPSPPPLVLRSAGPPPGRSACEEAPPLRPSPTPTPAAASAATSPFLSALSSSSFLFPPPTRLLFSSSSGADAHVGPWRQTRRGGASAPGGISRGCRRRCFPFSPAVSAESAECVLRARNTHLLLKNPKKI